MAARSAGNVVKPALIIGSEGRLAPIHLFASLAAVGDEEQNRLALRPLSSVEVTKL